MKIPFTTKDISVTEERFEFIKNTKGGSSGIFAGAIFWLLAVVISSIAPKEVAANFYIFGGIVVIPVGSSLILKMMGGKMEKSSYNSLIIISNMLFAFLYPLLLIIGASNLNYIPAAVAIINGAHLLVFMWIHYEFLHCIMAVVSLLVGCLFIFYIPQYAFRGVGLINLVVNLIFGFLVFRSTTTPLKQYNYSIR